MDPLIGAEEEVFGSIQQTRSKGFVQNGKHAIGMMEELTEIPKDLKARMTKKQLAEWAVLLNDVEEEWMATVECVRKLQLVLEKCMGWGDV